MTQEAFRFKLSEIESIDVALMDYLGDKQILIEKIGPGSKVIKRAELTPEEFDNILFGDNE